jgi:formylglycine-generating enzyme required for sulfatase activity
MGSCVGWVKRSVTHHRCMSRQRWVSPILRNLFVGFACVAIWGCAQAADDMILIPPGPFTMGRDDGPKDERPAHQVTLAAFQIDRQPVTNREFAEFLNARGHSTPKGERLYDHDDNDARIHQVSGKHVADKGFENHPVVEPSWLGAREYCAWRGKRLPTEAEWEKAARGNDARRYPWGNTAPTRTQAQFGARFNETAAIENFATGASPHGVLGMAGNAWHWVSSAYRPYPYRADDGREDLTPGPVRATRGGGHDSPAEEITTTQRGRNLSRNPRAGHHNISFRCAK